jgi:hypothetical protein
MGHMRKVAVCTGALLCKFVSGQTSTVSHSVQKCSIGSSSSECALPKKDHAMLQHHVTRNAEVARVVPCTAIGQDPYGAGDLVECCAGSQKKLGRESGRWFYTCHACTAAKDDPWASSIQVECCDGLRMELGQWSTQDWHYKCVEPSEMSGNEIGSSTSSDAAVVSTLVEWNVYWKNHDLQGLASVIRVKQPDIVGLCEFTASVADMAKALSDVTGRPFSVQPGRDVWVGYGTDIFFDSEKWEALEGGVVRASCAGSTGGPRAGNWVVLQDRVSKMKLITGGVHISYCATSCDSLHECEMGLLYDKFEELKQNHGNPPVVWMGDLNRNLYTRVMQNLLQGKLGDRATFPVDDLALTQRNTFYSGGPAIDHILGDHGVFHRLDGGRIPGQGVTGNYLNGADHFPIYTRVQFANTRSG